VRVVTVQLQIGVPAA